MDLDQIIGITLIFGSYGAMLALLMKSNSTISEMKRQRIEKKRRYAKKKIGHVLEVQRVTRHRRR
ncbi:Hypothetical protein TON_0784 [Thermococcus onnurineus NA1]|uniref:Uncharacterized protein n=1 Tax=Thermococcus onnurineus (strain NA1) TaxID=523850 RepID=B6YVU9_THEON|nr:MULTISPECIES: hypothetical protein [Thermococcus]ACJ16272.1 Hypothetical protein TON_0784 [Thermococcus onnurineus NA1]NJE47630.1 hypothetical protein [Thermococcus sp. GR7]NJE78956.1 hypothetical protein [Thermococcus sp. GR4]NJF22606.1 hypothetical protein [Thermococcus sp. GR5]